MPLFGQKGRKINTLIEWPKGGGPPVHTTKELAIFIIIIMIIMMGYLLTYLVAY
jgi:hypothetical protein